MRGKYYKNETGTKLEPVSKFGVPLKCNFKILPISSSAAYLSNRVATMESYAAKMSIDRNLVFLILIKKNPTVIGVSLIKNASFHVCSREKNLIEWITFKTNCD